MSRHLEFHPDLAECLLEDRALMAVVVPTLPWLMVTSGFGPTGSGPTGGAGLPNLPPLPGPQVASVGGAGSFTGAGGAGASPMVAGTLFAYYGLGYGSSGAGPTGNVSIGSGANDAGGGAGPRAGGTAGYGASVNSGYGTSLSALNGYGMNSTLVAIGQTSANAGEVANPNQAPAQSDTDAAANAAPASGVANTGAPMLGVNPRPEDNLLKGGVRTTPSLGPTGR